MTNEKFSWVELSNRRSMREFDYLVREVGEEELIAARANLGARKAYPDNLARILGVKLPADLQFTPAAEAREKIKTIIADFHRGSAAGGVGVQRAGRGPSAAPDLTPHSGVPGGEDDHD